MENSSNFFTNRQCKYYPCHKNIEDINCLFCFCPLYFQSVCPGNPEFVTKGDRVIKSCMYCTFPHKVENYDRLMKILSAKKNDEVYEDQFHGGEISENIEYDFSVNTNPLGMPKKILRMLNKSLKCFSSYPQRNCEDLNKLFSIKFSVPGENLMFGNGASELISLAVYAVKPKKALLLSPCFSGYERSLKSVGAKIDYFNLSCENDFSVDEGFISYLESWNGDILFLCNPNNPTGKLIPHNVLCRIMNLCERKNIFCLLDECFISFTNNDFFDNEYSLKKKFMDYSGLIIIDAFTKNFSLAGLRCGFAITSNLRLLQKMKTLQPEWSVSVPSQIAAECALNECNDFISRTNKLIADEKIYLQKNFKELEIKYFPGDANFILIKCDSDLYKGFLEKKILIRPCSNFHNLDETYFRIAVRTHSENKVLVRVLRKLLEK